MSTNCKNQSGYDAISQLPDPIIGRILDRMPLQDAVRTSVLSTQWRFKWFNISRISVRNAKTDDKLLSGVLQMLPAHNGAILDFHFTASDELESFTQVDETLNLVYQKGVRRLIFFGGPKGKTHALDPTLFSCSQLSYLVLSSCAVQPPPPEFAGFRKLKTLVISQVGVTAEAVSTLISRSPLLQFAVLLLTENDRLEFTAPNLSFFLCYTHYKGLISIAAPRLVYMYLALPFSRASMEVKQSSAVLRIKYADSIQRMHLDYYHLKSLHRSGSRSRFENLRAVKLSAICFGMTHEVKCVLELMKSCPSLEKIIIKAFHVADAEEHDDGDVTFGEGLDLSCSRILELQMLNVSGSRNELAFIKAVLLKLMRLETIIIAPDARNCDDGEFNVLKQQVLQFSRTSPQAIVDFRGSEDGQKLLGEEHRLISRYFRAYRNGEVNTIVKML